jgi:hypothetical protein
MGGKQLMNESMKTQKVVEDWKNTLSLLFLHKGVPEKPDQTAAKSPSSSREKRITFKEPWG